LHAVLLAFVLLVSVPCPVGGTAGESGHPGRNRASITSGWRVPSRAG